MLRVHNSAVRPQTPRPPSPQNPPPPPREKKKTSTKNPTLLGKFPNPKTVIAANSNLKKKAAFLLLFEEEPARETRKEYEPLSHFYAPSKKKRPHSLKIICLEIAVKNQTQPKPRASTQPVQNGYRITPKLPPCFPAAGRWACSGIWEHAG